VAERLIAPVLKVRRCVGDLCVILEGYLSDLISVTRLG
jgi:hypothetical protein